MTMQLDVYMVVSMYTNLLWVYDITLQLSN